MYFLKYLPLISLVLTSCSNKPTNSEKIDCRTVVNWDWLQPEIDKKLHHLFPNHKSAEGTSHGLRIGDDGAHFPWVVTTDKDEKYSVILNLYPQAKSCRSIGYQFIKLNKKTK